MSSTAPAATGSGDAQSALRAARAEFAPEVVYLNTASLGLPARRCLPALQQVQERWRSGRAYPPDYDGRLVDLDALERAATATGARVLLDTTQAVGWLPVRADRFAYTVCGGYKWLLAPRGTCFFTVQPQAMAELVPHTAGWYAGAQPWDSIYGAPLRLATDARRFDVSPVWHSWVAQAPALDLLSDVGLPGLHAHAVGLANAFRAAVGVPEGNSAIVSVATAGGVAGRLERARIAAGVRAGRLRLAFHVNNDLRDVAAAAEALAGHVHP